MFGIETETLITYGLSGVTALIVLIAGVIASSWLSAALSRIAERKQLDSTLSGFFSKIIRWVVLLITGLFVLDEFGIETASFAVILGAAGLAIGLALQGTLSNFASGVMLLMFRPFKVGDMIRASGELGKVHEVDLFSTSVNTLDNRRLILPNSKVYGDVIENLSYNPQRRADVNVGVNYDADIDRTRAVLESAVRSVPEVLNDPAPVVVLIQMGASSVDWVVRAWAKTDEFALVKEKVTRAVKVSLDEAGIGIPFPQMDVHLGGSIRTGDG